MNTLNKDVGAERARTAYVSDTLLSDMVLAPECADEGR